MELPIAVQAALRDSEERFSNLLGRLGLDRKALVSLSTRIRNTRTRSFALPPATPAGGRRKYHV